MFVISYKCLVNNKPIQPSLIFSSKYLPSFRCKRLDPGLTLKHSLGWKGLLGTSTYSLIRTFVKYGRKKFYNHGARIDADDSIRSLDPKARNCRFPDERDDLKLYKSYSQSNCYLGPLL